jgi:hypothetical protein
MFGTFHFEEKRQIVHVRCSAKGDQGSCKVVMNQSADWVSAVPDARGRIHLIGVEERGAVWYTQGNTGDSWSLRRTLLDENTP